MVSRVSTGLLCGYPTRFLWHMRDPAPRWEGTRKMIPELLWKCSALENFLNSSGGAIGATSDTLFGVRSDKQQESQEEVEGASDGVHLAQGRGLVAYESDY